MITRNLAACGEADRTVMSAKFRTLSTTASHDRGRQIDVAKSGGESNWTGEGGSGVENTLVRRQVRTPKSDCLKRLMKNVLIISADDTRNSYRPLLEFNSSSLLQPSTICCAKGISYVMLTNAQPKVPFSQRLTNFTLGRRR